MRIIGGKLRHREISEPTSLITRPSMDRFKETLFNCINMELASKKVLDLFGGTGALAFESLSRGAKVATNIDNNDKAIKLIKLNAQKLDLLNDVTIIQDDYRNFIEGASSHYSFDIVFLDPPYAFKNHDEIIKLLLNKSLLNQRALVISEQLEVPLEIDGFSLNARQISKKYLAIYRRKIS